MFFFPRVASGDTPAGVTVSRTRELPDGEFQLDEYEFADGVLWFVHEHGFSQFERNIAAARLNAPEIRQLHKSALSAKEPA